MGKFELYKIKSFNDLPEIIQDDLLEWFNRSNPSEQDRAKLLNIFKARCFSAWNCPECGARVYECTLPYWSPSWNYFTGVRQIDRTLYPAEKVRSKFEVENGLEGAYLQSKFDRLYKKSLCNDCRKNGWIR